MVMARANNSRPLRKMAFSIWRRPSSARRLSGKRVSLLARIILWAFGRWPDPALNSAIFLSPGKLFLSRFEIHHFESFIEWHTNIFYILCTFLFYLRALFLLRSSRHFYFSRIYLYLRYATMISDEAISRSLRKNKWIRPTLASTEGKQTANAFVILIRLAARTSRLLLLFRFTRRYRNVFITRQKVSLIPSYVSSYN